MPDQWSLKGAIFGACSCDWGCPCNFDVAPSYGHCNGVYMFAIKEGHYGDTSLDGAKFAWAAHSPGPLHEGNVTALWIVDEALNDEQRSAIETLGKGDGVGLPFDILASVTGTSLDTLVAPFEVTLDGINSSAKIGNGAIHELAMTRVKNPVTGEEEELYLDKPTGFTSKRSELGMSTVARFSSDELSFEHDGKYAEFAEFEYAGP